MEEQPPDGLQVQRGGVDLDDLDQAFWVCQLGRRDTCEPRREGVLGLGLLDTPVVAQKGDLHSAVYRAPVACGEVNVVALLLEHVRCWRVLAEECVDVEAQLEIAQHAFELHVVSKILEARAVRVNAEDGEEVGALLEDGVEVDLIPIEAQHVVVIGGEGV